MPSMSSVSMGQGLRSCLEPKINGKEMGSACRWSSIYSLSGPSQSPLETKDTSSSAIKTTNFTKRPLSIMKNLELCTETLGCETGVVYPLEDLTSGEFSPELKVRNRIKRRKSPLEFPPPLTILGGEDRLRLGRKREDGRLLLIPFKPSVLEAERTDGRLLLRLLPCMALDNHHNIEGKAEEEKEDGVGGGGGLNEEDGEGDGGYLGVVGMEMNGSANGEEEMGIGKYTRAGRCKVEDGGGPVGVGSRRCNAMLSSDAFWLTTS